jgi:hypothetical protein
MPVENPGLAPPSPGPRPDDDSPLFDAWKETADRWRAWNAQKDDWIRSEMEQGSKLEDMINPATGQKFQNKKEMGMSDWSRWGPGGMVSQMGDVNPNFTYDWASGKKIDHATRDQNVKWVPIEPWEYDQYKQMNQLRSSNPNATAADLERSFRLKNDLRYGHATKDEKSGNYYNVGTGNPNDPSTWEWFDNMYRPTNAPAAKRMAAEDAKRGGAGPGVNGGGGGGYGGGYSGGGYGGAGGAGGAGGSYSDYGGGYGPGYSPGSEANYYSQAGVNSALQEQMRNDILSQQIGIRKNLEGYQRGSAIYDYLQNEVYGPILGVQFQDNEQGLDQYSAAYGQQTQAGYDGSSSDYGGAYPTGPGIDPNTGKPYSYDPTTTAPNDQSTTPTGPGGGSGSADQVPKNPKEGDTGTGPVGTGDGTDTGYHPVNFSDPPPPTSNGYSTQPVDTSGTDTTVSSLYSGGMDQPPPPSADSGAYNGFTTEAGDGAYHTSLADSVIDNTTGEQSDPADPTGTATGNDNTGATSGSENPLKRVLPNGSQDNPGYLPGQPGYNQYIAGRNAGYDSGANAYKGGGSSGYGGPVNMVNKALPKGTYKQTGTQALDPNMSNTWAKFLAPTWGKINEASQEQQKALARSVPRGGEQTKAISDSINQRYGALQGGWQGLVPGAIQGISDIGKEMYFQQPTQYSGAGATMEGGRQADQQYQLGLAGLKSNEKIADKQAQAAKDAKPGFWGGLGSALGGAIKITKTIPSDVRVKKDVKPFNAGLDALKDMKPKSYKYNGKGGTVNNQRGVSSMAQNIEKKNPKAVIKAPDGMKHVDLAAVQSVTINAIKELDKKVSAFALQNKKRGKK